jgi:hypothetical protein
LTFIISSKANVQRGFSIHPSCDYALFLSVQTSLLLSLTPSLPSPIMQ